MHIFPPISVNYVHTCMHVPIDWLRTNVGEERLTDLSLPNLHRDIIIDVDGIINRFSEKPKKTEFCRTNFSKTITILVSNVQLLLF